MKVPDIVEVSKVKVPGIVEVRKVKVPGIVEVRGEEATVDALVAISCSTHVALG